MPWTKLKNIILVILLITNLCLLSIVLSQDIQSRRQQERALESAVVYLRDRGVQVEDSQIPKTMELLPQVVERDLEGEERGAAALLRGPVTVEARGGEVYRYHNELGSVQFHSDGTFSARLDPKQFPLGEDRAAGCLALLEQLGFRGGLLEEKDGHLTFRQYWEDTPLFSQQVTVICERGGASALSGGRRLVGQPEEDTSRRTVTVATALVDLHNGVSALGDVCNRIDEIQPGYVATASLSGPMALTPVWQVTTDTGAYQLDTVTGQVSRVS